MTPPPPNARWTEETTTTPRKPFCFREKVGEGFIAGSALGSAYHFPKGGLKAVWTKVPRLSCYFAVYMGAYSAIKYAMVSARGKEEPVLTNAVATAGACAITTMPWGVRTAVKTALVGGAFAGAFHAGLLKLKEDQRRKLSPQQAGDPAPAACPSPVEFPGTPPVVA